MKNFLSFLVELVARIHDYLLHINDSFELYLNDKQLHFLVIGGLGLLLFFASRWLFQKLSRNAVAWVYTLTVMVGLSFAIEIGQYVSGTGNMELADIVVGIWGILGFGGVYTLIHYIIKVLRSRKKS